MEEFLKQWDQKNPNQVLVLSTERLMAALGHPAVQATISGEESVAALGHPTVDDTIRSNVPSDVTKLMIDKFGGLPRRVDSRDVATFLEVACMKGTISPFIRDALKAACIEIGTPEMTQDEQKAIAYESRAGIAKIVTNRAATNIPSSERALVSRSPELCKAYLQYRKLMQAEGRGVRVSLRNNHNGEEVNVTGDCHVESVNVPHGVKIVTENRTPYLISRPLDYSTWLPISVAPFGNEDENKIFSPRIGVNTDQLEVLIDHPERTLAIRFRHGDSDMKRADGDLMKVDRNSEIGTVRDVCNELGLKLVITAQESVNVCGRIVHSDVDIDEIKDKPDCNQFMPTEVKTCDDHDSPNCWARSNGAASVDVSQSPHFKNYEDAEAFMRGQYEQGFRGWVVIQGNFPTPGGGATCPMLAEWNLTDDSIRVKRDDHARRYSTCSAGPYLETIDTGSRVKAKDLVHWVFGQLINLSDQDYEPAFGCSITFENLAETVDALRSLPSKYAGEEWLRNSFEAIVQLGRGCVEHETQKLDADPSTDKNAKIAELSRALNEMEATLGR